MWSRVVSLVVLLLVLGGCVSRTAGPGATPATDRAVLTEPPSREAVGWADQFCTTVGRLHAERDRGQDMVSGTNGSAIEREQYLVVMQAGFLMSLADQLEGLGESGFPAVDAYVAGLADALTTAQSLASHMVGDRMAVPRMPQAEQLDRIEQVVGLLDTIEPRGDDLPTVLAEYPEFAAAYELAPRCASSGLPPVPEQNPSASAPPQSATEPTPPADGTDLGSCADGICEVAVRGNGRLQVGEFLFHVTVTESSVTLRHDFAGGGGGVTTLSGPGGEARFGSGGTTVVVHLHGIVGGTATLEFRTG